MISMHILDDWPLLGQFTALWFVCRICTYLLFFLFQFSQKPKKKKNMNIRAKKFDELLFIFLIWKSNYTQRILYFLRSPSGCKVQSICMIWIHIYLYFDFILCYILLHLCMCFNFYLNSRIQFIVLLFHFHCNNNKKNATQTICFRAGNIVIVDCWYILI